jgi:hypothetical protein
LDDFAPADLSGYAELFPRDAARIHIQCTLLIEYRDS